MKIHTRKRVAAFILAGCIFWGGRLCAQQPAASSAAPAQPSYEKLKQDYEAAVADRNNILAQTRSLMEYKNKNDQLVAEMNSLTSQRDSLSQQLTDAQALAAELNKKLSSLEVSQSQAVKENEELKKTLEKMQIEYKIVPETRRELERLEAEKAALEKDQRLLQTRIKRLEDIKINNEAQIEIFRSQLKEARDKYDKALKKNRALEKKAEQLPRRFTELARQNKILTKETALMHYNLGVFYTKNKEYSRAVAEFEKAIELNPDEPSAHYNLGYIYAEYLVDRPKAISSFRKFLSLVKSDDKDVDWVKKYILTWETWQGEKPMQ